MKCFLKQWRWGLVTIGVIAGLYAIQVVACYVRILVPYKTIEHQGIKLVAVYGITDSWIFRPLIGLTVFLGDGNRLRVYRDNRLIYEAGFDLFSDIDWDGIQITPERIKVPGLNPEEFNLPK